MSDKDQRIHEPTPRRKQQFRKKGDIARSKDLVVWATLSGGLISGGYFAGESSDKLADFMARTWMQLAAEPTADVLTDALATLAVAAAPTAAGAVVGWLLAAFAQLGWPPAIKPLGFDLVKIVTFQGAVNVLNPKAAAFRVLMSALKVAVVFAAAWLAVRSEYQSVLMPPAEDAAALATRISPATKKMLAYGTLALAVLASVDFFHQRRQIAGRLRMTPEELKREHKDMDGDPHMKRRRRDRARDNAKKQRPEIAVQTADVVIVNPTHYSVALRYDTDKEGAPRVVTKGTDSVALKIRETARKRGIPIVEEPPLARLLHKLVDDGQEIPEDLFHAVAEVLAYVYRLRNRTL